LRRRFIEHGWACLFDFCWAEEVSEDITAFSFALPEEQYAVGDLHKANLLQINKRLQRRYERAGLPLVLGGVDISLNEDSAGCWSPYWQLQVYGVTVDLPLAEVKKRLAVNLPISERIPRPLRVRDCIEIHQGLSYIIKPMFIRRVSYVDPTGRLNTRKVPIKSAEMRELAVWLDQYPLTARYLLIGCRRYEDRIEPDRNRRTNP